MIRKLKNYFHLFFAVFANLRFGFPTKGLIVIGVTGTDGKTTTTSLIYHILNKAGFNASMISSVGAIINGKKYSVGFHVTNPSSWSLQRFIKMIKREKERNVLVLEVTSHALDQYRNWGINFDIGVLTNITKEHLDYHRTYENYVKTKTKLLKAAKVAVINKDDYSYKFLAKENLNEVITYGFSKDADVNLENIKYQFNLPGKFNQYNFLAAVSVVRKLNIPEDKIEQAISDFTLPKGRLEEIYSGNFKYIVDFAHTPNSFLQLLRSLKSEVKGRIIHVFGSAGERDERKRPEMGKISSTFADVIILTSEDPRSEHVEKINGDIEEGINKDFKYIDYENYNENDSKKKIYFKIDDRSEAINFAISIARENDLVISTGKGHEESMNYGKGEEPWDEFAVANRAIKNYEKK